MTVLWQDILLQKIVSYWKDHRVLTTKLCIDKTWKVTAHQLFATTILEVHCSQMHWWQKTAQAHSLRMTTHSAPHYLGP